MQLTLPTDNNATGENFDKNFLFVDTSKRFSDINQPTFFYSVDFKNEFINIPTTLQEQSIVMGYREVLYRGKAHFVVKVNELYPKYNRVHINFYNNGTWQGWKLLNTAPNYSTTSMINLIGLPSKPIKTSTETFTALDDGYLMLNAYKIELGSTLMVCINDIVAISFPAYHAGTNANICLPLAKDDVIKFITDDESEGWIITTKKFFYSK